MWMELLFGLVFFRIFKKFIYDDDGGDDIPGLDKCQSTLTFAVANRLENIYDGKAYVGLRIPDPDTSTRQHIEIVMVTKREVMVVAVRNFSGFVDEGAEGSWNCSKDGKHTETHPDPVMEVTKQIVVLEAYLEQRGVSLPKGHLIGKVVLPNQNCRTSYSIESQPEVIPFEKWLEIKSSSEPKSGFSNWIKDAFRREKSEVQDGLNQRLHSILITAPMWDRSMHISSYVPLFAVATFALAILPLPFILFSIPMSVSMTSETLISTNLEERLKSLLSHLNSESGILDRLVYKHKNQHRRCPYFQALLKVRRDLKLLHCTGLGDVLNALFPIIDGKKVAQKALLPQRLEFKADRIILGQFIEFKGNQDDVQALRNLKRSRVSRIVTQKSTVFEAFGRTRINLLYFLRDYRSSEGTSASEQRELAVKRSTEVLFQPLNSKKPKKFKLSSTVSIALSG